MNLENIILKSQTERQILYNIMYKGNLKNNTNESIYKTETCRHRKQSYGSQRGKGREEE